MSNAGGIGLGETTGVILAGGASSRMGSNKALLPYHGGRFIEIIHRQLARLFPEVVLVTNTPDQYSFLPCRTVADIFPGSGPLGGIHAALRRSTTKYVFAVGCDMPFLDGAVVRMMADAAEGSDVVIADCGCGFEPLHAFYSASCLPHMEDCLRKGKRNVVSFFDSVKLKLLTQQALTPVDPTFRSFRNINTPGEYFALRNSDKEAKIQILERVGRHAENVCALP